MSSDPIASRPAILSELPASNAVAPDDAPAAASASSDPPADEALALHPLKEAYLPVSSSPPNQDIRVAVILSVRPTPKALIPALYLELDFGPVLGKRFSSSQIAEAYPDLHSLVGTKVCAVVNVGRIRLGRVYSEALTLGVSDEEGRTVLIRPDPRAKIGSRIF